MASKPSRRPPSILVSIGPALVAVVQVLACLAFIPMSCAVCEGDGIVTVTPDHTWLYATRPRPAGFDCFDCWGRGVLHRFESERPLVLPEIKKWHRQMQLIYEPRA